MKQQQGPFSRMELFLTETKLILSNLDNNTSTYEPIRVVMGDKTCDLDSAICTLAQGLFEYIMAAQDETMVAVIPVMNITESEFRLKTEVIFWLKFHNIPQNLLIFRDHIDLHDMQNRDNKKLELILVDHHTLPDEDISLKSSVVKIIDHRQQDISWPWHDVSVNIEIVGSCATLVARNILIYNPSMMNNELASLLQGPIIVDTCNLTLKVVQNDVDILTLDILQRRGGISALTMEIYNRIMEAKADISGLTHEDLLIKDLKVISGIPIVVLPLLVENFLMQSDGRKAVKKFSSDRNNAVIVLLGVEAKCMNLCRDIAVFYKISDNKLGHYIRRKLVTSRRPNLCLKATNKFVTRKRHIYLYKQENLDVTRKNILPIVRRAKLWFNREQ